MSLISSLVNAFVQSDATNKAAKTAQQTAQLQNDEAKREFDLQRSDLAPYRELGVATLPTLKGAYGLGTDEENAAALERFKTATPDYGFGLEEGKRAVQGALQNGVGRFGGGALKALTRYGQDYATTRFGNWRTGLNSPAGYGSNAVAQGNQAAQNYSAAYQQNTGAAGDARASAYLRNGQIWGPLYQNLEKSAGKVFAYGAGGGFG